MPTIPQVVQKRAIFEQEFKSVVESKSVLAPVSTKLVAKAKYVESPYSSVTVAKAHTQDCKVPIGTLTVGNNELVLDRKIGNAIKDCKEELSYAAFDLIGNIRGDLYASVMKKLNTVAVADVVSDGTVVAGTQDLSTSALVQAFLVGIATENESSNVGLKQKIDGATVVRGAKHGKPFVAAGATAFTAIVSKIAALASLSSLKGLDGGNMIETPYGVTVINLGASADNAKRLIYGTGGAITMAYREDQIEVDMGEYVSTTTYDDGASGSGDDDIDITHGDSMLEKTWYMYAQTKGRNGVFADVKSLISTQLMA